MPKTGPDRPIKRDEDRLNFGDFIEPIINTIREASRSNQLPLAIGLFGRWGSGKTSLMRMIEEALKPSATANAEAEKQKKDAAQVLRWSWPALAAWGLLILLGIFFTPLMIRYFQGFDSFKSVVWLAACFGVIGWLGRAAFELWLHGLVEHNISPRQALWLVCLPLLGGVYGLLAAVLCVVIFGLEVQLSWPPAVITLIYLGAIGLGAFAPTSVSYLINLAVQLAQSKKQARQSQQVEATQTAPPPENPAVQSGNFQVIWFNAWKFANEKELWAALLQEVLRQVNIQAQGVERLRIRWQLWKNSINWKSGVRDVTFKLLPTLGKTLLAGIGAYLGGWLADLAVSSRFGAELGQAAGAAGGLMVGLASASNWLRSNVVQPMADIDLNKYRKKSSYKDHLTFLAEFSEEFKQITRVARGEGNPIVLMLDDLDRCLPEQAVSVLEAIKLFIGEEAPVIFILGADREFVERAIEVKYEKLYAKDDPYSQRGERFSQLGHEYLEKIVQLSFNLPPIMDTQIDEFIDKIFSDNTRVKDNSHIFAAGLLPNPRQVIRTINIYSFLSELAEQKGLFYSKVIQPDILAVMTVIQYRWPDLYNELKDSPTLLDDILASYTSQPHKLAPRLQELVNKYAGSRGLQAFLNRDEVPRLKKVKVAEYIYLTPSAQAEAQTSKTPAQEPQAGETADQKEPLIAEGDADKTSQVDMAGTTKNELSAWKTRVDEWKAQKADSALLSQLESRLAKAATLSSQGDLSGALSELERIKPIAEQIQLALEKRQQHGERLIEAKPGSDGRLVFSRARSYRPIEVRFEGFKSGQPGEITAYMPDPGEPQRFDKIDGGDIAYRVMSGQASETETRILGEILGKYLSAVLAPMEPSPQAPYRLRLTASEATIDVLPWELATLSPDHPPLGLDPRFSLVRGASPASTADKRRSVPLEDFQARFVLVTPPQSVEAQVESLGQLKFQFPSQWFAGQDPNAVYASLTKEKPIIAHMVGSFDPKGGEQTGQSGSILTFQYHDLDVKFDWLDIGLLVLDTPGSTSIARRLVGFGAPRVLAWKSAYSLEAAQAFYFPFYDTLLRSGQPEFALTEGRRAIAAVLGDKAPVAISPTLYLGSKADAT